VLLLSLVGKSAKDPIATLSRICAHNELNAEFIERPLVQVLKRHVALAQNVPALLSRLEVLDILVAAQKVLLADQAVVVNVQDVEQGVDVVAHVVQRGRPLGLADQVEAYVLAVVEEIVDRDGGLRAVGRVAGPLARHAHDGLDPHLEELGELLDLVRVRAQALHGLVHLDEAVDVTGADATVAVKVQDLVEVELDLKNKQIQIRIKAPQGSEKFSHF
jgi:hypothetical protein